MYTLVMIIVKAGITFNTPVAMALPTYAACETLKVAYVNDPGYKPEMSFECRPEVSAKKA